MNTGFTTIDYIVLFFYLIGVSVLGSFFYKEQRTIKDFFLAGRSMGWLPVCLSIIATDLSAISYMGAPAWSYQKDLQYGMGIFLFPFIVILAAFVFVRTFYKLNIYTTYEYLEKRFNVATRSIASFFFICVRGGWVATAIYVPSLALSVITGLNLVSCILIIGIFATLYTTLGGMKAVIWTDVMQFIVLVGGILAVIVVLLRSFGGNVGEIWHIATIEGHTKMFTFKFDPTIEVTIWSVLSFYTLFNLNSYGTDQVIVQRCFTAKSLKESMKALIFDGIIALPITVLLYLIGIGFVGYYHLHPQMLSSLHSPDQVLPHFIVHALPSGLSGLVIAGIFAATMSSVDSGINSLTTVSVVDFYKRFFHNSRKTEKHYLKVSRCMTLTWGLVATFVALFVRHMGTIFQIIGKINSFFTGPLLSIFLLGILTRRATSCGVILGAVCGLVATFFVATFTNVSWMWYIVVGCGVTFAIGYLLSLFWQSSNYVQLKTIKEKNIQYEHR